MWKIGILRRLAGITARQLLVSPSTSMASGSHLLEHCVDGDDQVADRLRRRSAPALFEEVVGLAHAEVVEEDLVELVVVVLAGVHQHVLAVFVEACDARATGG